MCGGGGSGAVFGAILEAFLGEEKKLRIPPLDAGGETAGCGGGGGGGGVFALN
jgi:hypothetical protein